jgi:dTDP-4-amino-4,6-dideoxygalactose transaminase
VTPERIPFIDLRPGEDAAAVRAAIDRVIARGWFVLGPEVEAFEAEFAAACGAPHAVGVGSGTDAIALLLRAIDVRPGDEVIVPALTAAYTGLAVLLAGATPVFADVEPSTLTLDPAACEAAITPRTVAIVPVHLYGQAADMEALHSIARRHSIAVIEDCCQAHLATHRGTPVGTRGVGGAFSFYPTKNLGALGDAGAVVTQSAEVAAHARLLRNYGERERFEHVLRGLNSRLDAIQAAILSAKLPTLARAVERRRALATVYDTALDGTSIVAPATIEGREHSYHLYVVQAPDRDAFRAALDEAGVGTAVHYPTPVHRQPAYRDLDVPSGFPVAESLCARVVSLPLSETHTDEEIAFAAAAARAAVT